MTRAAIRLTIPGPPVPMERARKGKHGWYTPQASLEYRERIQAAWLQAGRPTLHTAPLSVCAYFHIPRPPTHLKKDGTLRPRHQHAIPPGDTDNYAKAIADALNGLAYHDDKQITCWSAIVKCWATQAAGDPRTDLHLWTTHQ